MSAILGIQNFGRNTAQRITRFPQRVVELAAGRNTAASDPKEETARAREFLPAGSPALLESLGTVYARANAGLAAAGKLEALEDAGVIPNLAAGQVSGVSQIGGFSIGHDAIALNLASMASSAIDTIVPGAAAGTISLSSLTAGESTEINHTVNLLQVTNIALGGTAPAAGYMLSLASGVPQITAIAAGATTSLGGVFFPQRVLVQRVDTNRLVGMFGQLYAFGQANSNGARAAVAAFINPIIAKATGGFGAGILGART